MIIGIDIGGTKVAGGLVDRKGRLEKTVTLPTKANEGFEVSFGQVLTLIKRLINQAGGPDHIKGIGMCCPGPLNPRTGIVINPPNLAGWVDIPVVERVEKKFQIPTRLENDANAAGLAEVLFGAAVGFCDVFYVTVSTGVGTGIIINKKIYHGKNGFAAEGGHVTIDYHSPYICGCGTPGDIESLAAGPGIVRRASVRLLQEHTAQSLLRERTRNDLRRLTPEMIQEAAASGDGVAKAIIEETGYFLGVWLASMITLLDPEAIIIGGGVSRIGKPLFDMIRKTIPRYTVNRQAKNTPVLPAKLQKDVGVFGAASLFLQEGEEAETA